MSDGIQSDFSISAIHNTVRDLLIVAGCELQNGVHPTDFVFQHPTFGKTALEMKLSTLLRPGWLRRIGNRMSSAGLRVDTFVLVVADKSDRDALEEWGRFASGWSMAKHLVALRELASFFGAPQPYDLTSAEDRRVLQERAFGVAFAKAGPAGSVDPPNSVENQASVLPSSDIGIAQPTNTELSIGRYRLLEKVGEGGMGVVYKAKDPKLGRLVAIKTMTGPFAEDEECRERFLREARAIGKLQHPNIATLYEIGVEGKSPFIVMEFLEGQGLDKIIATGTNLTIVQKLEYAQQICSALHYAHEHDIVHRDVKPANVIVIKGGAQIKLVDFGISRAGNTGMTKSGVVIGTASYMAPEQIAAREVLDRRADIFSLGAVLYELLTHNLPFAGSDPVAIAIKILREPFPRLASYLADYPAELDGILNRALAKDREERYSTAEEMASELSRVIDQLKRNIVGQYLADARNFLAKKDIARARELLLKVLEIEPLNKDAKQFLDRISADTTGEKRRTVTLESGQFPGDVEIASRRDHAELTGAEQATRAVEGEKALPARAMPAAAAAPRPAAVSAHGPLKSVQFGGATLPAEPQAGTYNLAQPGAKAELSTMSFVGAIAVLTFTIGCLLLILTYLSPAVRTIGVFAVALAAAVVIVRSFYRPAGMATTERRIVSAEPPPPPPARFPGVAPNGPQLDTRQLIPPKPARDAAIPFEYISLSRQFAVPVVKTLFDSGPPLERHLRIGQPIQNCLVVLSDIKNFSTLVKLSDSTALRDAMGRYYRSVRELVWQHGGVLDKFIGDAVFAVFNYPGAAPDGQLAAMRFCTELIRLGRVVLDELTAELNEVVETGTRVGMAHGDLWVLDIGQNAVEVSFIGNTINLAARLEKACEVDGVLIDHRSYTSLAKLPSPEIANWQPTQRTLEPGEAKGQLAPIRCWQINASAVLNKKPYQN